MNTAYLSFSPCSTLLLSFERNSLQEPKYSLCESSPRYGYFFCVNMTLELKVLFNVTNHLESCFFISGFQFQFYLLNPRQSGFDYFTETSYQGPWNLPTVKSSRYFSVFILNYQQTVGCFEPLPSWNSLFCHPHSPRVLYRLRWLLLCCPRAVLFLTQASKSWSEGLVIEPFSYFYSFCCWSHSVS